jgi:hypothetical protein
MKTEVLTLQRNPFNELVNINHDYTEAGNRGCPIRFRATNIVFGDEKYYDEISVIQIKVHYQYGDYEDNFVLGAVIHKGVDTECNVVIPPDEDINYREGKCSYCIVSGPAVSLILNLLY